MNSPGSVGVVGAFRQNLAEARSDIELGLSGILLWHSKFDLTVEKMQWHN